MDKIENMKKFLSQPEIKDYLNENDFDSFYKLVAEYYLGHYDFNDINLNISPAEYTELFYKSGINPLDHISNIPDYYLIYSNITSFTVPSSVKIIGNSAFSHSEQLQKVTILPGTEKIDEFVFYGCKALKEIDIPNTVKYIGNMAFGDTAIEQIEIPEGVEELGEKIFQHCDLLNLISLPSTLKKIKFGTLGASNNKLVIIYNGKKEQFKDLTIRGLRLSNLINCTDGNMRYNTKDKVWVDV